MEEQMDYSHSDRVVKEVKPIPMFTLSSKILFPKTDLPNYKALKEHLQKEGKLEKNDIIKLIKLFKDIIKDEPNITKINDPVTIVGDIHGQYYDLLKILEVGGDVSNTKYLFLGDYVDRGSFSTECVFLLMALKINFKKKIIMLRGNHECRHLTSFFNFKTECEVKYDSSVYDILMDAFDCLPLACIVNEKFLAVHGGLSPDINLLSELSKLNRFIETPKKGPLCDIMWSDPCDKDEVALQTEYEKNKVRGCSFYFGAKAAIPFLSKNNCIFIVRGHEAQIDGYKMFKWNPKNKYPSVITVFSAPNYCDVYDNKGAIIKLNKNNINIQQYSYSPHPFILPDFLNVFSWSLPFVSEKIGEMLLSIIKKDESLCEESNGDSHLIDETVNTKLRMKVKFLTMLMKMYRTLREENELIMKLKGFCPGNKIPRGILMEGPEALKTALQRYDAARNADVINEKMPE
ncbi:MAG: metallophosphoesterase [archaeon]|nr:metallophosphoesterase [archaeon]